MRGSASPRLMRRSSASDDGRVLVGSSPTRLYILRTALVSTGGAMRTAASASASGAFRRASCSTTVAPSNHRTPGRTTPARSGASVNRIDVRRHDREVRLRIGRDDAADALGDLARVLAR